MRVRRGLGVLQLAYSISITVLWLMSSCLKVLKVGSKSNKSNKQAVFLIFYQNKNSLNQKYCFPRYWFDAFSFHIQVCMRTQIIRKTMAFGPKDIFWLRMYVINWYKLVLRVYICKLTEMMHLLVHRYWSYNYNFQLNEIAQDE